MATDVLATVWDLAVKVKKAHEGVQGNSKQCTRLSVLVESVATSLKSMPAVNLKKPSVIKVIPLLSETLRSAEAFIEKFKHTHWIIRTFSYSSITAKFRGLTEDLISILTVFGLTQSFATDYVQVSDITEYNKFVTSLNLRLKR